MHREGRRDHACRDQFICRQETRVPSEWDFLRRSAKPGIQVKRLPDFYLKCNSSPVLAISPNSEGKGGDGRGRERSGGVLEIIVVVRVEGQVLGIPLKRQLFLAVTLVVWKRTSGNICVVFFFFFSF